MNPLLSTRQLQVLKLAAEGKTRKESALILGLSPKTVEYLFNGDRGRYAGIYDKLGTNSLAVLTQWALKNGIAEWVV